MTIQPEPHPRSPSVDCYVHMSMRGHAYSCTCSKWLLSLTLYSDVEQRSIYLSPRLTDQFTPGVEALRDGESTKGWG